MKHSSLLFAAILLSSSAFAGNIRFSLPEKYIGKNLTTVSASIKDMAEARSARDVKRDTLNHLVSEKDFNIDYPINSDCRITFVIGEGDDAVGDYLFLSPKDSLTVSVVEMESPAETEVRISGSELMDGVSDLSRRLSPVESEIISVRSGDVEGDIQALFKEYESRIKKFIEESSGSPAAVFAVTALDGQDFLDYFRGLPPQAKSTPLYPLALRQAKRVEESLAQQKMQEDMETAHTPAPDFTLPDLAGKKVSLKDFRGKWVILDFWGSWCGWCIKGMPGLKEAYAKYKPDLEIIGIDCGDTDEQWRAAVKRLELPWVQLYNAQSENSVEKVYGVQGFPTKVIVDPEGKIYKFVTGEDPEFYNYLSKALGR